MVVASFVSVQEHQEFENDPEQKLLDSDVEFIALHVSMMTYSLSAVSSNIALIVCITCVFAP